jgi:ribosomal protein S18 acetylase RimI-like enzyme
MITETIRLGAPISFRDHEKAAWRQAIAGAGRGHAETLPCMTWWLMPKLGFMPDIEMLSPDQWRRLRNLRLSALRDSPHAFLSTYAQERSFGKARWQAEFDRGDWHSCQVGSRFVSLLGVTREHGGQEDERYLEFLWVSPDFRRCGIALDMLAVVLKNLRMSGIRVAFLWVLDGNDVAVQLYQRVGFVRTHHRQQLQARPGRTEERMMLPLD